MDFDLTYFRVYKEEIITVTVVVFFVLLSVGLTFFLYKKWWMKRRINSNIRRIRFYMAGSGKTYDLCCELAHNYYQLQKYDLSETWFKEALDIDPNNSEACLAVAGIYKKNEKYEELKEICEKLVELNPSDPDALRELGWAYYYCEKYKDAMDVFVQVKNILPGDVHTRYCLGLLYLNNGKKIKAIEEYRHLRKLDDKKAAALFDYIYPDKNQVILADQNTSGAKGDFPTKDSLARKPASKKKKKNNRKS